MPMPHAIGEPTPGCRHGYWEHSQFNRCPWCHGRDQHNARAVPVRGPGNGWLLKEGDSVCVGCGGPGGAGWGLLPSGAEAWTAEQHREYKAQQVLCYGCTLNGLEMPIQEIERMSPAPGLPGVRVIRSGSQTYWQCERCWRWGRPRWAHACGPRPNWHTTVRELRERDGSLPSPALGDYSGLASAGLLQPQPFEPPSNEAF